MKRHQHITKVQSELIQEKKLIDLKLDETIAKHCYLEKTKHQFLRKVVSTITSSVKLTKVDKIIKEQYLWCTLCGYMVSCSVSIAYRQLRFSLLSGQL